MYVEQAKTSLSISTFVVDIEVSMRKKVALENIFKYLNTEDQERFHRNLELSNTLYITDGHDNNPLEIEFEGKTVPVDTESFLRYSKHLYDEERFKNNYFSKSVIVIGNINRMDPLIVMSIINKYNSHFIVLYGDPSLAYNDEYKSIYSSFFTNTQLDIVEYFDTEHYDISKKKIYNVINKIRRGVAPEKLSQSSIFSIQENKTILISDIENILDTEPDTSVVIPEAYYNEVNSQLYTKRTGRTSLIPEMGDILYNVYPLIVENDKGEKKIIEPMNEILITQEPFGDLYFSDNKIFQDVNISINGELYYSVPIDMTFFLGNFSADSHPEHADEYVIINNIEAFGKRSLEPVNYCQLKPIPYKVLKPLYVKQKKIKNIVVYNLLIDPIYSIVNNNIYSSLCTASDSIKIITSNKFEIL